MVVNLQNQKKKNEDKQMNRQTNLVTGSLIELPIAAKYLEKPDDVILERSLTKLVCLFICLCNFLILQVYYH